MQYEQLVEFKRKNGHCTVARKKNKEDASLGNWVKNQRYYHNNKKMPPDRKKLLDELDFTWKSDSTNNFKLDDKLWHQHYKKLLEYKRINGNCKIRSKYQQDKFLAQWVRNQRYRHDNNKMPPDRKELLDALDFVWKADTFATRSSITDDVRGLAI
jgi:hypothetical protein